MGAAVGGGGGHVTSLAVVEVGGGDEGVVTVVVIFGSGLVKLKVQWHTGGCGGIVGVGLAVLVVVVGGTVGQVTGGLVGGGAGHSVRGVGLSSKGHWLTGAFQGEHRHRF
jgi:hypothetical protein